MLGFLLICRPSVYGIQTIGMCSHIYQITFFFHHLKLSLLWPTLFSGPHYDNCQVLPHSPQNKDYKAHPQHLLYKAPGSSLFWKLFIAGQPASATQPLEGFQNTVCFQPPEILSHYSSQVSSPAANIYKNSIGNTFSGSHCCQCSPCPHYLHAFIELCLST